MQKKLTAWPAVVTRPDFLVAAVGLAILLWAYGSTLGDLVERWSHDPQYSHGFFVPVFALFVLGMRGHPPAFRPSWWGFPVCAAGVLLRLAATYFYFDWLDQVSLLVCLTGLFVLLGGRPALRWSWPAVAFLLFMIPLPYRLEVALANPLQRVATLASTYVLQTLGYPALAEGNSILLNDLTLGVVKACSGLSMLMTFFALSTALALVLKRRPLDRAIIVLSAVPIALAANVARITLTGVLHETVGGELAHSFFHDLAGWFMIPFALVLLGLEIKLLSWLLVEPPSAAPLAVSLGSVVKAPRVVRKPSGSRLTT
jgi:exosortase